MKALKIISFYRNEKALIKRALDGNQEAQRLIYETHAPKMLSICRQYIKDLQFAEDTMIGGFVKVFKHLNTYRHEGSFEGWIRRIMIRESISFLRKKQFVVFDDDAYNEYDLAEVDLSYQIDIDQIQKLIDALPEGYKMVFVLHAIEGYKHQEIADMLGISESTSKSQLFKARRWLQKRMNEKNTLGYGTH
jgi:RNA polymerase sigma-70 factor (ECF subfamily)